MKNRNTSDTLNLKQMADALIVAKEEKEKRAAVLVIANVEKEKRAAELIIANKELVFQNGQKKSNTATILRISNEKKRLVVSK